MAATKTEQAGLEKKVQMFSIKVWIALGACFVMSVALKSTIFADDADEVKPKKRLTDWEKHTILRESDKLRDAIARGHALVERGVKNYPSNRQCFSCHHQTLPLLSRSLHPGMKLHETPAGFWNDTLTQSILSFTEASFSAKTELMREGRGIGGKALTVAYGLWAMDLAGAKRNETIDAMVDYLMQTQADDGAWNFQSVRPPAASSRSMTTAVAIYGLRAYGHDHIESNRLQEVFQKARGWSLQADETESQEELNGMIWLDYMLHEEDRESLFQDFDRLARRKDRLLRNQNEDGGWGQTADMPSDPYATGQTLLILAQVEYRDKKSIQTSKAFRKGVKFLLDSQESDGSWHVVTRAKPVQVFFDNGDPYGKDQFISFMATNWAVAALANFQDFGSDPLESFQVIKRKKEAIAP